MFQTDIGMWRRQPFEHGGAGAEGLANDVAQAYKQITLSTHICPYPSKKHRFCANLVTHPAGGWG